LQFEASLGKEFLRPYLEKSFRKTGLVELLKVKALSSSPSTTKKQKQNRKIGGKIKESTDALGMGEGGELPLHSLSSSQVSKGDSNDAGMLAAHSAGTVLTVDASQRQPGHRRPRSPRPAGSELLPLGQDEVSQHVKGVPIWMYGHHFAPFLMNLQEPRIIQAHDGHLWPVGASQADLLTTENKEHQSHWECDWERTIIQ
jgi:hypothetical protein